MSRGLGHGGEGGAPPKPLAAVWRPGEAAGAVAVLPFRAGQGFGRRLRTTSATVAGALAESAAAAAAAASASASASAAHIFSHSLN